MSSEYDDSIWELVSSDGSSDGRSDVRSADPWLAARASRFAAGAEAALDLGCGDGLYLQALSGSAATVFGADRSSVALGRAAERAPGATLHEVDANERLPLTDNCVDRIWCCDTLEHVVDTQVVLSEARRVLRPGGRLLVVTPDHPLRLRLRVALRGWDEHFDPFSPHLRFYTARSLSAALADCGFDLPAIERHDGALVAEAARG
jgi:ubiquinone/menaquinone biosynthesis C-methylase UbiE